MTLKLVVFEDGLPDGATGGLGPEFGLADGVVPPPEGVVVPPPEGFELLPPPEGVVVPPPPP